MVKVSVIVPIYGVAQFIEKCIRSLMAQTLQEMEFLVVDDHGPDNSMDIARKVVDGHPRKEQFKFLRPEHNLGAGMARNYALTYAQGEYVAFVDGDDFIGEEMYAEMYAEAKRADSELCCCMIQKDYQDGRKGTIMRNPHVPAGKLTSDSRNYLLTHYVSMFTSFVFRRDLLLGYEIRFPGNHLAEDSFFISCALMTASSIAYVDKPFYHYVIRDGSACTTKDDCKYKNRLAVFDKLLQYAKEYHVYDNYSDAVDYVYIKKGYLSSVLCYVLNAEHVSKTVIQQIRNHFLSQVPAYRSNRYFTGGVRVLDTLIHFVPFLSVPILRWYAKYKNIVS